jgi:hypothetical protein
LRKIKLTNVELSVYPVIGEPDLRVQCSELLKLDLQGFHIMCFDSKIALQPVSVSSARYTVRTDDSSANPTSTSWNNDVRDYVNRPPTIRSISDRERESRPLTTRKQIFGDIPRVLLNQFLSGISEIPSVLIKRSCVGHQRI